MQHAIRCFTTSGLMGLCLLAGVVLLGEETPLQSPNLTPSTPLAAAPPPSTDILDVSGGSESLLQVGHLAPEFQCVDDTGKIWDSREHVGKRILVLYFYPSDFSFCWTRQAEGYCNCQAKLAENCIDADVAGISGDGVLAHRLFKTTLQLMQPLLADTRGEIARKFGVPLRSGNGGKTIVKDANGVEILDENGHVLSIPRAITAARWTFVINLDGRIIYRQTDVAPKKDSQEVIAFLTAR